MIRSMVHQAAKMAIFTMHSFPPCPACRSVLLAANYLNLKIDVINYNLLTGEHRTPEFRKMNPLLTVPTVDDNGFYLYESRAVLTYLVNKYAADSSIYPKEPQERAVIDRMLYFDLGTIYKTQSDALLPKALRGEEVDPEKFSAYEKALQLFDDMLGKSNYAAGTRITLADISILATITTAQLADVTFDKYPNITAWINKLKVEIPSYKEINEIPLQKYKEELKSRNKK